MIIYTIDRILAEVVRRNLNENDEEIKKLFEELGPLIEADRQKPPKLRGFPNFNMVSPGTEKVFHKIFHRCNEDFELNLS